MRYSKADIIIKLPSKFPILYPTFQDLLTSFINSIFSFKNPTLARKVSVPLDTKLFPRFSCRICILGLANGKPSSENLIDRLVLGKGERGKGRIKEKI